MTTPANDDLKTAVEAMYRLALEGCQTSEEVRRVYEDLCALIRTLNDVADDAGRSSSFAMKKETAHAEKIAAKDLEIDDLREDVEMWRRRVMDSVNQLDLNRSIFYDELPYLIRELRGEIAALKGRTTL